MLRCELDAGPGARCLLHGLCDEVTAVSDNNSDLIGLGDCERINDVQYHRFPAHLMQRLRQIGLHTSAGPGSENDGTEGHGSGERTRTPTNGTKNRCPAN